MGRRPESSKDRVFTDSIDHIFYLLRSELIQVLLFLEELGTAQIYFTKLNAESM